jgi:predicted transcriptional regulator
MPRPKTTDADLQEREKRKKEWRQFRKEHLFTQVNLAEFLGISRRTVQLVEAGRVSPFPGTLRRFLALKAKHEQGGMTG